MSLSKSASSSSSSSSGWVRRRFIGKTSQDGPWMRTLKAQLITSFTAQQNAALDRLEACMPTSVVDSYTKVKRTRRSSLGDLRVDRIRNLLDSGFGKIRRSKMQIDFHEAFLAATSRHIYAHDDQAVDWARVKEKQGWSDTRSVVLCQTPRRFGKTWSVALFIAAYALCVGGSEQSIFSTGKRASGKMLDLIKQFCLKSMGFDPKNILKSNAEVLVIRHPEDGSRSIVNSYPAAR